MKNFRRIEWLGVPGVVVNDHHWAFYYWWEALRDGLIEKGASLVHVDQHKDMREPSEGFSGGGMDEVLKYTEEVLEVGNYIVPAVASGLIGEIQFVTGETGMGDMSFVGRGNKILNLDLDIFIPELGVDFEVAKRFLEKQLEGASFVTIAKSPGFIDQDLAEEFLEKLLT
jgi:hypothetical protein